MAEPIKGGYDYWDPGSWNAHCSMCTFKRKNAVLVKNWQGMWRCPEHNEPRHPQDFVKAVPDIQAPPWTQSLGADRFVTGTLICTENTDLSSLDPVFYISTETLYPLATES